MSGFAQRSVRARPSLTRWVQGLGVGVWVGGLVFEAHRLCVPLNSRLESNKEEEEKRFWFEVFGLGVGR